MNKLTIEVLSISVFFLMLLGDYFLALAYPIAGIGVFLCLYSFLILGIIKSHMEN